MKSNPTLQPVSGSAGNEISKATLGVLLTMVRSEMVRALEREFARKSVDLSFTQFLILKNSQQLGAVSATELARAVEIDGGAMTRQLDHMERKGYLRRTPHAQDRRALRIELTDAGKTLSRDTAFVCSDRVTTAAQSSLNEEEREQLHDYLGRVLNTLREKV